MAAGVPLHKALPDRFEAPVEDVAEGSMDDISDPEAQLDLTNVEFTMPTAEEYEDIQRQLAEMAQAERLNQDGDSEWL